MTWIQKLRHCLDFIKSFVILSLVTKLINLERVWVLITAWGQKSFREKISTGHRLFGT